MLWIPLSLNRPVGLDLRVLALKCEVFQDGDLLLKRFDDGVPRGPPPTSTFHRSFEIHGQKLLYVCDVSRLPPIPLN